MTETTAPAPEDAAVQRAAEQARLRKERREAKIRAGGTARLNRITGLGGGVPKDETSAPSPGTSTTSTPSKPTPQAQAQHGDPDEVDISEHYYSPAATARQPTGAPPLDSAMSEAQLRQMMLGFERPPGATPMNPFGPPGADGMPMSVDEDPMMKMLSQMMAGGGPGGGFPGFPGFPPPGVGAGAGGLPPGFPGMPQAAVQRDPYAYIWRILHSVFALSLGLYIALGTTFTGTKTERERVALAASFPTANDESVESVNSMEQGREHFFWMFATAEAILLTSRFFFDRARAPPSGLLHTAVNFLPDPFKGYVQIALRYGQIFSTVRSDILICVFVLGVCSWLRV